MRGYIVHDPCGFTLEGEVTCHQEANSTAIVISQFPLDDVIVDSTAPDPGDTTVDQQVARHDKYATAFHL